MVSPFKSKTEENIWKFSSYYATIGTEIWPSIALAGIRYVKPDE